nr:radical SAM protein [Candidatus Sigynarchaeota archaeon]
MEFIRVSAGSAALLGLKRVKMLHAPTTIHLLQYTTAGCKANCSFCPQARESLVDKKMLSRVSWPEFPWHVVKDAITEKFKEAGFQRVCLQTVIYSSFIEDMLQVVDELAASGRILISVALIPVAKKVMEQLKTAGAERVGIALDASTPALFSVVKGEKAGGPYTWDGHWKALQDALDVFGKNRVSTHLIAGLGEQERDIIERMQQLHDSSITIGLFAFTPVRGTRLETVKKPGVIYFRKVQLARHLIVHDLARASSFTYDEHTGQLISWGIADSDVIKIIQDSHGKMFETTGCPGCNRPYYTESPRGPVYNHPAPLDPRQVEDAIALLFPGT